MDDRVRALLVLVFGGLAAVMAALGVAGITARGVASRARELGVREALVAGGLLLTASVLSAWIPARRIRRIAPIQAIGEG